MFYFPFAPDILRPARILHVKGGVPILPLSEVGNAALAVHIMGNCCFSFFKSVVQLVLAYNLVILFSVEKFIERISNDLVLLVALDVLDIRSSIDLCVAV